VEEGRKGGSKGDEKERVEIPRRKEKRGEVEEGGMERSDMTSEGGIRWRREGRRKEVETGEEEMQAERCEEEGKKATPVSGGKIETGDKEPGVRAEEDMME